MLFIFLKKFCHSLQYVHNREVETISLLKSQLQAVNDVVVSGSLLFVNFYLFSAE